MTHVENMTQNKHNDRSSTFFEFAIFVRSGFIWLCGFSANCLDTIACVRTQSASGAWRGFGHIGPCATLYRNCAQRAPGCSHTPDTQDANTRPWFLKNNTLTTTLRHNLATCQIDVQTPPSTPWNIPAHPAEQNNCQMQKNKQHQ